LHRVDYLKPLKLGQFVVKNNTTDENETVENVEDFYLKYTMEKFEEGENNLNLGVTEDEKLIDEKAVLKRSTDLNTFLRQILKRKEMYVTKPKSNKEESAAANQKEAQSTGRQDETSATTEKDESTAEKDEATSKIDSKLAGEMKNLELKSRPRKLLYTDFVGLRSTFSSLLNCQYVKSDFVLYAEMFEGSIYLLMERSTVDDSEVLKHAYANRKLKQLCTKPFEKAEGENAAETIDFEKIAQHDLCFIFKSKVDRHRLLYSATMNCFEDNSNLNENPIPSSKIKSVELKSCRKLMNASHENNFRSTKTLKYWSHSTLVNNDKVCVAFFDDDYVVDEAREYRLSDLTKTGSWSSRICFHQFERILWFIKKSFIEKKVDLLMFRHEFISKNAIICEESNKSIVPDWYKEELIAHAEQSK